jgi:ABC-2 type transport system ATP-binding protein
VTSAISVGALTKRYGEIEAVRGIDFEVAAGETFGFLGPNGAGKSTTIKILCTLADPTSGTARVAGHDVVSERDTVRRNIGLVFQDTTLDNCLTGEQNLRFHADLYGVPKAAFAPRLRQVLEMVGLWDRRGSVVATYSGGMQRRLEIARGLRALPAGRPRAAARCRLPDVHLSRRSWPSPSCSSCRCSSCPARCTR